MGWVCIAKVLSIFRYLARQGFEMDFGDLVASAEQLTAEIDGARAGDLPRVERSLKHILDAGQSLLGKTGVGGGQDAKVEHNPEINLAVLGSFRTPFLNLSWNDFQFFKFSTINVPCLLIFHF